jgi:hypothetical protein
VATREVNKEEQKRQRAEIAKACREQYGMNYSESEITDCDGCLSESGRLFIGCLGCPIRKCAKERTIENCAHCPEYICQTLESFFVHDSAAKTRLADERQRISSTSSSGYPPGSGFSS